VELWRSDRVGRLVIRAFNEGGNNFTDIDLLDLIQWLTIGPNAGVMICGNHPARSGESP
jgi:hypothetical protein